MVEKFQHLPDISTIQPGRLIKCRTSEDKFSAEILLPGLWYTDFDNRLAGKLSVCSLAKLYECMWFTAEGHGFAYLPEYSDGTQTTMFGIRGDAWFSKKLQNIRSKSVFGRNYPIRIILTLTHIGRSTFTHVDDLYEYTTGEKLASFKTKVVCVSSITRSPTPFPEKIAKLARLHLQNVKSATVKQMKIPDIMPDAFQYRTNAVHSDCDMNAHVNHSVYSRWCTDAASEAAIAGYFSYFKTHVELYALKTYENNFIDEVKTKDEITVYTWENKDNNKCLFFAVVGTEKLVYFAKMEFYDGGPAELSIFGSKL